MTDEKRIAGRKRHIYTGRKESGTFVPLPHSFLEHPNFFELSYAGQRVLWVLLEQLRFKRHTAGGGPINNGWLSCTKADAEKFGVRSDTTRFAGLRDLENRGVIVRTLQGAHASDGNGRRAPNLFAVTLWPISKEGREKRRPLDMNLNTPIVGMWRGQTVRVAAADTADSPHPLGTC